MEGVAAPWVGAGVGIPTSPFFPDNRKTVSPSDAHAEEPLRVLPGVRPCLRPGFMSLEAQPPAHCPAVPASATHSRYRMPAGDLPNGVGQREGGAALRKQCDPVADFGDISEGSVRLLRQDGAGPASLHGVAGQHSGSWRTGSARSSGQRVRKIGDYFLLWVPLSFESLLVSLSFMSLLVSLSFLSPLVSLSFTSSLQSLSFPSHLQSLSFP